MDDENKKQFKINANVAKNQDETFGAPTSFVNSDCGNSSRTELEGNLEGSGLASDKISDSSGYVSLPWSNSNSGELFQDTPQVLPKSREPDDISKPNNGAKPLHKNGQTYVPIEAWHSLEESGSPESMTQFSDITHESFAPHILPTESPPIQVMERPEIFYPNRTPTNPVEWSITSNESLFSIHIGNDSFSKDYSSRMSGGMYRSGKLPGEPLKPLKSGELYQSQEFYRSGELCQSREECKPDQQKRSFELIRHEQASTATKEVEPNQNMDTSKDIGSYQAKSNSDEPKCDVAVSCINIRSGKDLSEPTDTCNANHHSDGKKNCSQALVSLSKKKPACPLCHCLYSSWMYCCRNCPSCRCNRPGCLCKWFRGPSCSCNCLSWPSCCCKPKCCNCKWPSCSCNCLSWPSCCCNCKWPSYSSNCLSWPSCCCKRPNCCNYKWPNCLSNCLNWPSCCCKWPNCCNRKWSSCCCKCHGSFFSRVCCFCWKPKTKRPCSEPAYALVKVG